MTNLPDQQAKTTTKVSGHTVDIFSRIQTKGGGGSLNPLTPPPTPPPPPPCIRASPSDLVRTILHCYQIISQIVPFVSMFALIFFSAVYWISGLDTFVDGM